MRGSDYLLQENKIKAFYFRDINFRSLVLLSNLAEKGGKLIW
jgi:hypothetical protein